MAVRTVELFDLSECPVPWAFEEKQYPWEVLPEIGRLVRELAAELSHDYTQASEHVWVGRGTVIAPNVVLVGPAVIGPNCELRPGAYIRENVIVGEGVVIGNSTELKNAILFNGVQVPHFNYVGDSILGAGAHLGAGAICSNFKSTKDHIKVRTAHEVINTGLRKFGALLGDRAEVGCGAVLNPGTVVGRDSIIYPLCSVRGVVPARSIMKSAGCVVPRLEA
ncbi:MAG: UDP-N-acetylglucosamine pyrophosphorylase [Firmicutes bacterium]|jgi:NDP-sugar pyrophosphorylase family protein|nr:UDP-N-acetylglucosamine pyrophosphorylase [Bacillota bacterium]